VTGDDSGDLTGRRLGNYRIDGVLGKGGMSVMYRATDVRLGRKVALKVIGEHLGADAEFRERFVDEARNTSAIDHANVVPLYDFGELDGMLYLAMRLVDGADLASLVHDGPLAPDRTLRLLDQVADALDSLHHRGFIHLDVKPANVLVTSRESIKEHVYLADFGLTRRGATGHRTRGGDFLGSPTYAAPEHLRGEPLDGRTDQYALACVFFVCLTGKPPYSGDVSAVIKGHLAATPPAVSQFVSVPPALDAVLRKGMAKKPQDRYDTCGDLVSAVRRALGPLAMSENPIRERDSSSTATPPSGNYIAGNSTGSQPVRSGSYPVNPSANPPSPPQNASSPGRFAGPNASSTPRTPAGFTSAAPRADSFGGNGNQPPWGAPQARVTSGPHPVAYASPTQRNAAQGFPAAYPMRVRPPAPAGSSASFASGGIPSGDNRTAHSKTGSGSGGLSRWLFVLLGIAIAVAVAIVLVLVLKDGSSGPARSPLPEIPVGTGSAGTPRTPNANNPPPLTIPIQPAAPNQPTG
jgi:serine/threonine-protein kinase